MLRISGRLLWSVVIAGFVLPGCSTVGIKNGVPYFSKQDQFEPEVEEDKWSSVGKMARGNRQLEDENDPLKPLLMSKEAQDIERNLGYQ
jgi:hypothetical protein